MKTWEDVGIDLPRGARGNVKVRCPKCGPTRRNKGDKSLSVNVDEGVWQCHNAPCDFKGSLGRSDYGTMPKKTYTPPVTRDVTDDERMLAWFAERHIPPEVVRRNQISVGMEYCPQAGKEVRAIRYPYIRGGEVVNYKFRAANKTFWMAGGAELCLYGLDDIADVERGEYVIIVEGEMDKLALEACGVTQVVSVPNGAAPNAKLDYLADPWAEQALGAADLIMIGTDMDAAGRALSDELARRIGQQKCLRIEWPEKDANDTLMTRGKEAVVAAIADAQPWPVAGIVTPRELSGDLEYLYDHGFDHGVRVGFPQLDEHIRPRAGLLTMVTGSPGSGKSTVLDNILVRLAERHDWHVIVCSPENLPLQRHLAVICGVYIGRPFDDGPTPRMSREEMRTALAWAHKHFSFVLPEERTIDEILRLADIEVYRKGSRGMVVDPWNELDHTRPSGMSMTEHVSGSLSKLRNWARKREVQVWLVAHPTKLQKGTDGLYPVATMYDISDSSHFFNKADAGMSVWRDALDMSVPTQVHIQKMRFSELGKVGMVEFTYDAPTKRVREVGQPIERPRETYVAVPWED